MPILPAPDLAALDSIKDSMLAGRYTRNGYELQPTPGGGFEGMRDVACWNWALAGGSLSPRDRRSATEFIDALVAPTVDGAPIVIRDIRTLYPSVSPYWSEMDRAAAAAKLGNALGQQRFPTYILGCLAALNGMRPTCAGPAAATAPYTLHMRSEKWTAWNHFSLGLRMPDGRRMIVQTVPGSGICVCCSVTWDEHMPEAVVGIAELHPQHVHLLGAVAASIRGATSAGTGSHSAPAPGPGTAPAPAYG